jgi:hypothetical protein
MQPRGTPMLTKINISSKVNARIMASRRIHPRFATLDFSPSFISRQRAAPKFSGVTALLAHGGPPSKIKFHSFPQWEKSMRKAIIAKRAPRLALLRAVKFESDFFGRVGPNESLPGKIYVPMERASIDS